MGEGEFALEDLISFTTACRFYTHVDNLQGIAEFMMGASPTRKDMASMIHLVRDAILTRHPEFPEDSLFAGLSPEEQQEVLTACIDHYGATFTLSPFLKNCIVRDTVTGTLHLRWHRRNATARPTIELQINNPCWWVELFSERKGSVGCAIMALFMHDFPALFDMVMYNF